MASIFDDLTQVFSMDDKTSRQGFANLFRDDPNAGFLDTMAREAQIKREAEREAMIKANTAAGGINPDDSFNAFQGTFPGNVNQAVVGMPDYGVDFSQMSNVNTAAPRYPVPQQGLLSSLGQGLQDRFKKFQEGYDNLSQEDALAMVDAYQQITAQEPTKFSSVNMPSAASTGYRIPIENLYNRGLLKI